MRHISKMSYISKMKSWSLLYCVTIKKKIFTKEHFGANVLKNRIPLEESRVQSMQRARLKLYMPKPL